MPGSKLREACFMRSWELKERLFAEVRRPRPWHNRKGIVLPDRIAPIDGGLLFSKARRLRILELGSGWGEFARSFLQEHPDTDYIAFEIKPDRILQTLSYVERIPKAYFRIVPVNFNWFLEEILPCSAFDRIIINFPDPWPKRRHWKHRLIQPDFPSRISGLLAPEGELMIATDYGPYARKILRAFRASPLFVSLFQNPDYLRTRPPGLYPTKFERIQKSRGKRPYYMAYRMAQS